MATTAPDDNEIYIITTNETFQLSRVIGVKVDYPDEDLKGRFNYWGLTVLLAGDYSLSERFEAEGCAIDARTAIDRHLTGETPITEHQRWDTIRKT